MNVPVVVPPKVSEPLPFRMTVATPALTLLSYETLYPDEEVTLTSLAEEVTSPAFM